MLDTIIESPVTIIDTSAPLPNLNKPNVGVFKNDSSAAAEFIISRLSHPTSSLADQVRIGRIEMQAKEIHQHFEYQINIFLNNDKLPSTITHSHSATEYPLTTCNG